MHWASQDVISGGNIRHREASTPLFERLITSDKAATMGDNGIIAP